MGDDPPTVVDEAARSAVPAMEPMPVKREARLRVDRVSPKRTRMLVAYHERLARFRRRIDKALVGIWLMGPVAVFMIHSMTQNPRAMTPVHAFLILAVCLAVMVPFVVLVLIYYNWPNHHRITMRSLAAEHEFKLCGTCLRDLRGEPRAGHCPGCGAFYGFAVLEAAWRELYHDAAHKFPEEHVVVEPAVPCRSCAYDLRGLGAAGRCPECGERFGDAEDVAVDA